jgi:hypothetical protein
MKKSLNVTQVLIALNEVVAMYGEDIGAGMAIEPKDFARGLKIRFELSDKQALKLSSMLFRNGYLGKLKSGMLMLNAKYDHRMTEIIDAQVKEAGMKHDGIDLSEDDLPWNV